MNEHTEHATRRLPEVGDQILCRGQLVFVTAVHTHEPGHGLKPIRDDWGFLEWVTPNGSRYAGIRPDGSPAYLPLVEPREDYRATGEAAEADAYLREQADQ